MPINEPTIQEPTLNGYGAHIQNMHLVSSSDYYMATQNVYGAPTQNIYSLASSSFDNDNNYGWGPGEYTAQSQSPHDNNRATYDLARSDNNGPHYEVATNNAYV